LHFSETKLFRRDVAFSPRTKIVPTNEKAMEKVQGGGGGFQPQHIFVKKTEEFQLKL
jgi:hypothetical protein